MHYGKRTFPLERCFPSSHQLSLCLGFDGCVKLKLIVSLFPLSSDLNLISALPPCEVHRGLGA